MIILTWIRGENQNWCALDSVRPSSIRGSGVYLVWYAGQQGRVVCLGQGTIATELERIKTDARLTAFKANGPLLVTWAAVSASRIDGVARYLAETWPPLIEAPSVDAKALEVNSPGWLRPFPDALLPAAPIAAAGG